MNRTHANFLIINCFLFCLVASAIAQPPTLLEQVEYENIQNKLYIHFPIIYGDTVAEYSLDKRNNFTNLKKSINFTQQHHVTLNVRWLNPINFQISLKDTLVEDPTDALLDSYLGDIRDQFDLSPFGQTESPVGGLSESFRTDPRKQGPLSTPNSEILNTSAFKDFQLVSWKLSVQNYYQTIPKADNARKQSLKNMAKRFEDVLKKLDDYLSQDHGAKTKEIFVGYKSIVDPYSIRNSNGPFKTASDSCGILKAKLEDMKKELDNLEKSIKGQVAVWEDEKNKEVITAYTLAALKSFYEKAALALKARGQSLEMLDGLKKTLQKSVTGSGIVEYKNRLYRKVFDIKRAKGKVRNLELTLKAFNYEDNDLSKRTEKTHATYVMTFRKYRFLLPVVSVGVFYSSLTLRTYEAGPMAMDSTFTVQEINNDGNPVYATMLNFVLNTKNSDLVPFVQFGTDPTKERPFLLLGGGLGIPRSRFAISAGAAWSWRQSLKSLEVDKGAESAAAIKNDIEYKFNPTPRAYLGIQFEF